MIVLLDEASEKTWDAALSEPEAGGTLFQSTCWAKYLRKTYNDRPLYVASLDKKGNIQGQLLAIESCFAKHSALTMCGKRGIVFGELYKLAITPVFRNILPFIFWENGPVILPRSSDGKPLDKAAIYRKIVEKIVDVANEGNCYEIKFARPAFFDDQGEAFSSLGFQEKRMGTILVDLDEPVDNLWKRLDNEDRRVLRRSMEKVEIAEASKLDDLKEFYDMHLQASKRAKTKVYPFSHFASIWNHFSPQGKIVVFIARLKNKPIGALSFWVHNRMIHVHAGGDSEHARSSKIATTSTIIWHAIKWASDRNLKYFDLAGVELYKIEAGKEKARNIFRFKFQWGGKLVEFHDYRKHLKQNGLVTSLNRFLADSVIHN